MILVDAVTELIHTYTGQPWPHLYLPPVDAHAHVGQPRSHLKAPLADGYANAVQPC